MKSKPKGVHTFVGLCTHLGATWNPKRLYVECEIVEELGLQIYEAYKDWSIA